MTLSKVPQSVCLGRRPEGDAEQGTIGGYNRLTGSQNPYWAPLRQAGVEMGWNPLDCLR